VRAVETGRPTLQAALAGTTAAFDAQGRRLLWHPAATGTAAVRLPLATRQTPFDRYGDWVPAACVLAIAIAVIAFSLEAARARADTGGAVSATQAPRRSRPGP